MISWNLEPATIPKQIRKRVDERKYFDFGAESDSTANRALPVELETRSSVLRLFRSVPGF